MCDCNTDSSGAPICPRTGMPCDGNCGCRSHERASVSVEASSTPADHGDGIAASVVLAELATLHKRQSVHPHSSSHA